MTKRTAPRKAGAVRLHDLLGPQTSLLEDALSGLARPQKSIPPKYFYDATGSALFELICTLPEYYLTRVEDALMQTHVQSMAAQLGQGLQLIEFGSGASIKTRRLIEAARPERYVPIEISAAALRAATRQLHAAFPRLSIEAVLADFTQPLQLDETILPPRGKRVVYFPGSTIGNFTPEQAQVFLEQIAGLLGDGGALLIGVDLKKERSILEAAYNDRRGITARFNLNVLARMNRELDADFQLDRFRHRASYDEELGRIEMHLESLDAQTVHIAGRTFYFASGETLHTEISCKYSLMEFQTLAGRAGFVSERVWTDPAQWFSIQLLRAH